MTLFDPGLQPERTELAWRRTALAIAVGSLVALRVVPAVFGDPRLVVVGALGVVGAAALWVASARRARRAVRALLEHGDRTELPGGLLPFCLAAFTVAIGLAGTVIVVAAVARG